MANGIARPETRGRRPFFVHFRHHRSLMPLDSKISLGVFLEFWRDVVYVPG
jgi:hypothetical protein